MGATEFRDEVETYDLDEAFRAKVELALCEHGYDPYNGTISTTHLLPAFPFAKTYSKRIQNKFEKKVAEDDLKMFPDKYYTKPYNLGVVGYQPLKIKYFKHNERPARKKGVKTLQLYQVKQAKRLTLQEAKEYAKSLVSPNRKSVDIYQRRTDGSAFKFAEMKYVEAGKPTKSWRQSKTKFYAPIFHYELFIVASD